MDATIRRAGERDATEIARVQVESWKTTYPGIVSNAFLAALSVEQQAEQFRAPLADPARRIFVVENVEDHDSIFGFIAGGAARDPLPGYDAELYAIYLLAHRQTSGIGRRLCHHLASDLRSEGYRNMFVWVLQQNPAAAFYQRLGGVFLAEKQIEIGEQALTEIAFGWPTWNRLT